MPSEYSGSAQPDKVERAMSVLLARILEASGFDPALGIEPWVQDEEGNIGLPIGHLREATGSREATILQHCQRAKARMIQGRHRLLADLNAPPITAVSLLSIPFVILRLTERPTTSDRRRQVLGDLRQAADFVFKALNSESAVREQAGNGRTDRGPVDARIIH